VWRLQSYGTECLLFYRLVLIFRRHLLPPSSGLKSNKVKLLLYHFNNAMKACRHMGLAPGIPKFVIRWRRAFPPFYLTNISAILSHQYFCHFISPIFLPFYLTNISAILSHQYFCRFISPIFLPFYLTNISAVLSHQYFCHFISPIFLPFHLTSISAILSHQYFCHFISPIFLPF